MLTKKCLIAAILICGNLLCFSQNRNNIWCFGDSSGIDFNNHSNPTPIISSLDTRGTCVSIADSIGQLLFYANTRSGMAGHKTGLVWNKNNQLMQNGDSIAGNAWYNEFVIVPMPGRDSLYYLFSIGVTSIYWLDYSIIDMSQNGGLGSVIQKNIQLLNFPMVDCLTAIKHGNGRDWWLLFRRWDPETHTPNNEFHSYLITPDGIINYSIQNVGVTIISNAGNISFNNSGDRFIFSNLGGAFEEYNFDRCTGLITVNKTISPEVSSGSYPEYFGSAWSKDESKFYVSTLSQTAHLIQFDMNASDVLQSADTLWSQVTPVNAAGMLRRAPDNKIYFSCAYVPCCSPMYPYADSLRNMYNENLSVINQPDNLGTACDFQPYSFYLGGKRTYWGLPNNPDYDLGTTGACGVGVTEMQQEKTNAELFVSYIGEWEKLFVNAQNIKGRNCQLKIFAMDGREVFSSAKKTLPPYFTQDVDVSNLASGLYVVRLVTEREILTRKFIKE